MKTIARTNTKAVQLNGVSKIKAPEKAVPRGTGPTSESKYSPNYKAFLEFHCKEIEEVDFANRVETLYQKPTGEYVLRVGKTTLDGKLLPAGKCLCEIAPDLMIGMGSANATPETIEKAQEDRFKRISCIESFKVVSKLEALRWVVESNVNDEDLRQDLLGRLAR